MQKEQRDEEINLHVRRTFQFKKRNKGARSIEMTLEGQYQIIWNLKRIRRIMKKYAMICPHRKAKPYRQMMKETQEHRTMAKPIATSF
jgi:hypothetical protein